MLSHIASKQTARSSSDGALEDAVAADLGLVTLDLSVGAVELLYEVFGHFPHDPGSWSAVARRHCSIALTDARVDV